MEEVDNPVGVLTVIILTAKPLDVVVQPAGVVTVKL
jgi:hypothetical protein